MLDYYKILDIPRDASVEHIKRAYKRLALKYHPDKNPGNTAAEEYFKVINEAKSILTNPSKKEQYDILLNYAYAKYSPQEETQPEYSQQKRKPYQEKSVYDRYGRYDWRKAPKYKEAPNYRIDKNYLKAQAITLGSVFLIAVIIISGIKINNFIDKKEEAARQAANDKILVRAKKLYYADEYREALIMVKNLINKNPMEARFYKEQQNMISSLATNSTEHFENKEYAAALKQLEVLRDYQSPTRLSTWKLLAQCHYELKDYNKAIHAYKYVLMRNTKDIELLITIADIYKENLNSPKKAIEYYTEAKSAFKQIQGSIYGNAFELVMPIDDTPELYYELFIKRAEANKLVNDYEEALTDYNWAVFLRPSHPQTYVLRAKCWKALNRGDKACRDFDKAINLGYKRNNKLGTELCS